MTDIYLEPESASLKARLRKRSDDDRKIQANNEAVAVALRGQRLLFEQGVRSDSNTFAMRLCMDYERCARNDAALAADWAEAADRIEQLEAKVKVYEKHDGMDGAIVHSIRELLNYYEVPKAAFIDDHVLNAIVQRNLAELALTQSQAEVAAAYERAAQAVAHLGMEFDAGGSPTAKAVLDLSIDRIRDLTPADAITARDQMIAEARAQGMREAVAICSGMADNAFTELAKEHAVQCSEAILDAITKGDKV